MKTELQPRDDAEVAAAAAERPEQVRVLLGVDAQELAVRRDDLGGEQVVDGHAVLARQEADAAGERDAADADGAGVAEAGREPVLARRDGVVAGGQAGPGPGGALLGVDLEAAEVGEVEHDAALGDAVAGGAVAAAADGQLGAGPAGEPDDVGDVVRVGGAGDDGRPAVDAGHEDGARLVVAGVLRRDGGALDGGEREHASRVTARTRASLGVSHRFAGGYPYRRALLVPEPLRRR